MSLPAYDQFQLFVHLVPEEGHLQNNFSPEVSLE